MDLPTAQDILAIPALLEDTVPDDAMDFNGHLNVRQYLDLGATGVERFVGTVGIDDDYRNGRRMGLFAAEHHLRYLRELRAGDAVSVHPRMLARSARAAHVMSFLLDRTNDVLAYTLEVVVVHVSMDTRRTVPFPPDVAAALDERVAGSDALGWPAPVCGVLGVRG